MQGFLIKKKKGFAQTIKKVLFCINLAHYCNLLIMNEQLFWQMIADAKAKTSNVEDQVEELVQTLMKRPVKEIIAFQKIFEAKLEAMCEAKLFAAAHYIMAIDDEDDSEENEDRFSYFCAWLIAQGKEIAEKAIENPDSLADVLEIDANSEPICESEMMLYVADNAYEMKTGDEDFYDKFESDPIFELRGELEEGAEYATLFPKLVEMLQSKES